MLTEGSSHLKPQNNMLSVFSTKVMTYCTGIYQYLLDSFYFIKSIIIADCYCYYNFKMILEGTVHLSLEINANYSKVQPFHTPNIASDNKDSTFLSLVF